MNDKRKARPVLVLFLLAFFGVAGFISYAMHWVDSENLRRTSPTKLSAPTPGIGAAD